MRSALFWDITQRRVVIVYRRFGTIYLSHLQGSRSPIPRRAQISKTILPLLGFETRICQPVAYLLYYTDIIHFKSSLQDFNYIVIVF
jgi:hypothetical protein